MGINDSTQNDLTSYYDSFLRAKQGEHKEKYLDFEGWFSASTAGSCFRKQFYNINGYEGSEPDETSMRLLRLILPLLKNTSERTQNNTFGFIEDGRQDLIKSLCLKEYQSMIKML